MHDWLHSFTHTSSTYLIRAKGIRAAHEKGKGTRLSQKFRLWQPKALQDFKHELSDHRGCLLLLL